MRQAYDYWQNQPDNYPVARRAAASATRALDSQVMLGGVHEGRAARSTYSVSHRRHARQTVSHSHFPGRPSTSLNPLGEVWSRRPGRRAQRPTSTISVSVERGLPPVALFQGLPAASHPQNPYVSVKRREPMALPCIFSTP